MAKRSAVDVKIRRDLRYKALLTSIGIEVEAIKTKCGVMTKHHLWYHKDIITICRNKCKTKQLIHIDPLRKTIKPSFNELFNELDKYMEGHIRCLNKFDKDSVELVDSSRSLCDGFADATDLAVRAFFAAIEAFSNAEIKDSNLVTDIVTLDKCDHKNIIDARHVTDKTIAKLKNCYNTYDTDMKKVEKETIDTMTSLTDNIVKPMEHTEHCKKTTKMYTVFDLDNATPCNEFEFNKCMHWVGLDKYYLFKYEKK